MRKILITFLFFLILQVSFAQEKAYQFDEYFGIGGNCDIQNRYEQFILKLSEDSNNKGVVVIYLGDTKKRFGNSLAFKSGVNNYLEWLHPSLLGKIDVLFLEGKELFRQEFWIIPKNAKSPYEKSFNFDWSKLEDKYLFSQACLDCEPSYPMLSFSQTAYKEFAEILKQNTNLKGLIFVNNYTEIALVKKLLAYTKLPRQSYQIKFKKIKPKEANIFISDFYLVPQQIKK